MKNTMMNREGYYYDALNNTLNVTATFLKKASVLGSKEYEIIQAFRKNTPNVNIQKVDSKRKASNPTISYKQMEKYIEIFDDENKTIKGQFEKIRQMSQIQPSPYKYVKKWFEGRFPDYQKQVTFDDNGNMIVREDEKKEAAANTQPANEQATAQSEAKEETAAA